MEVPWILMDRSPPADGNILSRFQWYFWKRSWRLVKQHSNSTGCVVSPAHKEFVAKKIGLSDHSSGIQSSVFAFGILILFGGLKFTSSKAFKNARRPLTQSQTCQNTTQQNKENEFYQKLDVRKFLEVSGRVCQKLGFR